MQRWMMGLGLVAAQAAWVAAPAWAQALPGEAPQAKVGDSWYWVRSDRRTGHKDFETRRVITKVSPDRVEATEDGGAVVMSGDMTVIETPNFVRVETARFLDFPLAVGKKWSFKFVQKGKTANYSTRWQYDAEVTGIEKVKTPAGEFDAFKLVYKGFWNNDTNRRSGHATVSTWYAPAARTSVRTEFDDGYSSNATELVEIKLAP